MARNAYLVPEIQFAYSWTWTCFIYYWMITLLRRSDVLVLKDSPSHRVYTWIYLRGAQEWPFCLASIADVLGTSPRTPWGRNAWRSPKNVSVDYFLSRAVQILTSKEIKRKKIYQAILFSVCYRINWLKNSPKKPVRMKELISFRVITSKMMVSFSPPGWWCLRNFSLHLLFLLRLWVVFRLTSSACSSTFWERSLDSWHMWSHFLFSWLIDPSLESAH